MEPMMTPFSKPWQPRARLALAPLFAVVVTAGFVPIHAADAEGPGHPTAVAPGANAGETGPGAPAHPIAGSAATSHEGHEDKPELITFPPRPPQIITSLVTLVIFGLLVVILSKYAWGPIVS